MIPLAIHSHFSLMRGTASPGELCRAAQKHGYQRLALADRDNLYGLWPFLEACERHNIDPIIGAELTEPSSNKSAVVLVKNNEGYRNLCRLISQRHMDHEFELIRALSAHAHGLLILGRDADLLTELLGQGIHPAAGLVPGPQAAAVRKLSRKMNLPLVALPPVMFLQPEDHAVHRLLRAIDLNTSLSRLPPESVAPPQARLMSPEEYALHFQFRPEALTATHAMAEQCEFRGPDRRTLLPPWQDKSGLTDQEALRRAVYAGARDRYGDDLGENVVDRLEYELNVIGIKGFSGYFLIVQDIIRRSPRICGRGSAAASLVAYCLGITNVCPVRHNLYFERFLNPGRDDPPDIDVDFAWDERDEVLQSVLRQYSGRAAMVCNHVAFQPRMAIREVAKVYGLPEAEITRVTKRLPWHWPDAAAAEGDIQAELQSTPLLKGVEFPPPWPEILRLAARITGKPRYISVHVGGMVITPGEITGYAPIEQAPKGVPILQWEKDGTETAGLVKIDLLGNRSLAVIRDALANIRANGIEFNESEWDPENDQATQTMIAQGRTMGCFYIESPAMRLLQQKAGMGDFEHLVIHSSIIRPAANEFIREYLRRLKGGAWEPLHPLLADVLNETFGIMVYQEDVSKAARALAGFSSAEADGLRKTLGKKNKARRLQEFKTRFIAGAQARGVDDGTIESTWTMILSFGGYSFCKPHSASYARVSFQAAYLKAHYPAEFMAAVIRNQGGFYSTFAYVSEARRLGLEILPPDINRSRYHWQGGGRQIRAGLQSIADLEEETRLRIVAQKDSGCCRSFEDFLEGIRPGEKEIRALIYAGAFDGLAQDRVALLWSYAAYRKSRRPALPGQELFTALFIQDVPKFPSATRLERLRQEFKALGFLCGCHPLTLLNGKLDGLRLVKAGDIGKHVGRRIRIAGWLITAKTVATRHGDAMEFITFEDETGVVETVFFPDAYQRLCRQMEWNRPFILSGKVDEEFGAITLAVDDAEPLMARGSKGKGEGKIGKSKAGKHLRKKL